jgi:hypothetical protein
MRTTLDIEEPILTELRRLAQEQHRPIDKVASDLLAEALEKSEAGTGPSAEFHWHGKQMGAKVDLSDRDAIYEEIDKSGVVR